MNASIPYLIGVVLAVSLTNLALRAFPFLIFGHGGKVPPFIDYLGKVISPAAIAMLVVYCFASTAAEAVSLPPSLLELGVSGAVVVLLQLKWKNPLISICCGTALYMLLLRS